MSIYNKHEEVKKVIEVFRDTLFEKYGIELSIHVTDDDLVRLKLEDLEKLMIELFHYNEPKTAGIKSMGVKTRKKQFIMHKTVFAVVCFQHGYSKSAIGDFLDNDHSSIINLLKSADNYYYTGDKEFNYILKQFKAKIKTYVSAISAHIESGNKPQPVLNPVLPQEQSVL